MTEFNIEKVREIIDGAEAYRDGDGDKLGKFSDQNAYDFLRCARFLLGSLDFQTKRQVYRTEAERNVLAERLEAEK